jgi:hypothetical protein
MVVIRGDVGRFLLLCVAGQTDSTGDSHIPPARVPIPIERAVQERRGEGVWKAEPVVFIAFRAIRRLITIQAYTLLQGALLRDHETDFVQSVKTIIAYLPGHTTHGIR